jgi:hypothetical protein
MSYTAKKYGTHESAFGNMGIPPHDHVVNAYTGGNLTSVTYYRGGLQASGENVATIVLTYDGNGNLLTVTRTK